MNPVQVEDLLQQSTISEANITLEAAVVLVRKRLGKSLMMELGAGTCSSLMESPKKKIDIARLRSTVTTPISVFIMRIVV